MIVRVIRPGEPAPELEQAHALRHEVFVVGQNVPIELEIDAIDPRCDHAVALVDDVVVGTGRLLPNGTIGRMAVAEGNRGQRIGAAVLAALEEQAAARGHDAVELHAQLHAAGFYDRAGYERVGDVYLEAGIQHVTMRKRLS
ncbi:MAG: family N-acetyltransferase [Frankiales bacterium]|nr:family N-acetyltransferase [Frankiales bacterium]